jgi:curved DNA-binding protein CbpA
MDFAEYRYSVGDKIGQIDSDTVKVNPFRLFGLPEPHVSKFTRDQLKANMRRLVLITHPDKPTGSEKKFKIVSECYKYLLTIVDEDERLTADVSKKETIDKSRIVRQGSDVEIPKTNFKRFTGGNGKGFDIKGFNQYFDEVRMDETESRGHGDWLKSVDPDAEVKSKRRIAEGKFQEVFEEERQRLLSEKRITTYKGVQPLLANSKLGGISLATGSHYDADDDSGVRIGGRGGVDVRRAHEIGVLPVSSDNRSINTVISSDEARRIREQARLELTEEEKEEYNRQIAEENVRQARVRANIEKRNSQIETHYAKVNLLLRN